jgi:hypothetical protein
MLEAKLRSYIKAILAYERMIEEEELVLVHKAVEIEMEDIQAKMSKAYSF